jgi:hypothetical protein
LSVCRGFCLSVCVCVCGYVCACARVFVLMVYVGFGDTVR